MYLNRDYRIGMRAIKTAIAVFFCGLISMIFKRDDVFCASIAAIICLQPTYNKTLEAGIDRFIGTFLGGIIGYISLELSEYIPNYEWLRLFTLPFCILLVIYICNIIDRKSSVSIGCIVILVIVSRLGDDMGSTFLYVIYRVADTIIGILVAMLVNKFIFPIKPQNIDKKSENDEIKS